MQSKIWLILQKDALSDVGLDGRGQARDRASSDAPPAVAEENFTAGFNDFDRDVRVIASRLRLAK